MTNSKAPIIFIVIRPNSALISTLASWFFEKNASVKIGGVALPLKAIGQFHGGISAVDGVIEVLPVFRKQRHFCLLGVDTKTGKAVCRVNFDVPVNGVQLHCPGDLFEANIGIVTGE